MKAITVVNPGPDSRLEIQEVPDPDLSEYEILVGIKSTALNRADLLQRQGNYPSPEGASDILGLEMAGIVEEIGPGVTNWKPGDRVFSLLPGGGYAQYCVIHEQMGMPIPGNLNFKEAAAIPETFLTAYQALDWLGELKQNETVLIHAGGSGVGTSAIQLARQLYEARILATAGKDHKLETCKKLGAEFTYNYRKEDFSDGIVRDLGKSPVDLIIDFVGAPYWDKNIEVISTDGRIVYLSMLGGHKIDSFSLLPLLRKRLTVRGSTLRSRSLQYKIVLTGEFSERVLPLIRKELIKPVIDSEYHWEQADEAHQRMADNKNTGKIVLEVM